MSLGIGGIVSLGGSSGSGGGGSTSGIQSINSQTGPAVSIAGVNGIIVTAGGNVITIDGAGASGTTSKFAASFSSISSGLFTHNLGSLDVIVQVYDNSSPRRAIMPDDILLENANQVSVIFNIPQTGRIIIV